MDLNYQSLCLIEDNFLSVTLPAKLMDLQHYLQQLKEANIIALAPTEWKGTRQNLVIISITSNSIAVGIQSTIINLECNISFSRIHYYMDNLDHYNLVSRIDY